MIVINSQYSILFIFTVIELTENQEHIARLSEEIMNGKLYKSAKVDDVPKEPVQSNQMELKISFQSADSRETEIIVSNEKCSYKVPKFEQRSASVSSLSSQLSNGNSSMAWMKMQKSDTSEYSSTYCEQFSILLQRMLKQKFRNTQGRSRITF